MRRAAVPLLLLAQVPLLAQEEARAPLRVMTFNVRYGTATDGKNRWMLRRRALIEMIRRRAPHICGLQEALAFQQDQILEALPHYRAIGQGRKGGQLGEHTSILYDKKRLSLLRHGDFWLSKTPSKVASKGWDAALPRICTFAVFRDRVLQRRFVLFNTHLDHRGKQARIESARLLVQRITELARLPFLLTGDFNAGEKSEPLRILHAAGLRDTFRVLHPDAGDAGTFGGFTGRTDGPKIDYVLAGPRFAVRTAEIVRDRIEDRYPSDHYPVLAELTLPPRPRLRPVLSGDPWVLAKLPELGELNAEKEELAGHTIFAAADGTWQLWACIRNTAVGSLLHRWQGKSLEQGPWRPAGVALRAAAAAGEKISARGGEERLQSPFVLRADDARSLFYGARSDGGGQICLATSKDGLGFVRHRNTERQSRLFAGPGLARDPMVLRIGGTTHCYYAGGESGTETAPGIYCRTSKDLLTWSAPVVVLSSEHARSPFVLQREGLFYLFCSTDSPRPLTTVRRSADPLDFGKEKDDRRIGTLAVTRSEILEQAGQSYISSAERGAIRLQRLKWLPRDQKTDK